MVICVARGEIDTGTPGNTACLPDRIDLDDIRKILSLAA
jgi:hypothetical protein